MFFFIAKNNRNCKMWLKHLHISNKNVNISKVVVTATENDAYWLITH